jgi:protein ImuB
MFAVIFVPDFRLQAALRWRAELDSKPVAVVDGDAAKSVVAECNEAARRDGVTPGMPVAQAFARCPALVLLPCSPSEEAAAGALLLEMAFSLSPSVEATAAGCCTVDLQKDNRGRWETVCGEIARQLGEFRLGAKIGVAPNPDLAFIAARRAEPVLVVHSPRAFLSQLAVAEIDPPPQLLSVLHDWGIHTLGQLTGLPRGQFADRLGPEADGLWQRAAGKTTRLLRLVRPAEEFAEAFDFEGEIETLEPLYFVLRRFLGQLCARLGTAHRVAARLDLALPLENGARHERAFAIPSPTADEETLFRILCTHLDGLQLDQRLTGVRLRVAPARPDHQQFRLFDTPLGDPNKFAETLARIIALAGAGNVGVAEIADTHRPDSFRLAPPSFHVMGEESDAAEGSHAIGLPLRRYRPPLAAEVRMAGGRPAQVFSDKAHGEVVDALGPYRQSGNWWEGQWHTEEWDVEIAGEGVFRIARRHGEWLVEGCYDDAIY